MQLPDLSLILVMAIFWATFFVLRATVFRPLGTILEEREGFESGATRSLEAALASEKDTLLDIDRRLTEARRDAMVARETARAEAGVKRHELLEAAREQARLKAVDARARLETDVAAAREQLRSGAQAIAGEVVTLALGRKVA